jgi:hypothetical protein
MTILNIHMKDKDKKKLKSIVEFQNEKSMSEYIRKIISEKLKIETLAKEREKIEEIKIPEYIPKNKYIGFVNGAIIGVADNPSEISLIAAEKFPDHELVIKFNGPKPKRMEYCFMSLSEIKCWNYVKLEDFSYPIIPVSLISKSEEKKMFASVDTASSLCVVKKDLINLKDFEFSREEEISTAAGIEKFKVFMGKCKVVDIEFEIEFIVSPIAEVLPFTMLIGRNLLDQLDAYFLGKKQIICLKLTD